MTSLNNAQEISCFKFLFLKCLRTVSLTFLYEEISMGDMSGSSLIGNNSFVFLAKRTLYFSLNFSRIFCFKF